MLSACCLCKNERDDDDGVTLVEVGEYLKHRLESASPYRKTSNTRRSAVFYFIFFVGETGGQFNLNTSSA